MPCSPARAFASAVGIAVSLAAGWACAGAADVPITARLESLPRTALALHAPVELFWDEHQIPVLVAAHDDDVPFALGLVHAHLRLAQMEVLRRVASGRLAEAVGPLAAGADVALRALDLGRAVPAILARLPPGTRRWIDRYVAGVNTVVARGPRPPELALLGLTPAPWTAEDVLAVGRLAAADVNWLTLGAMLRLREVPGGAALLERLRAHGAAGLPSFGDGETPVLLSLLAGAARSGSNAFAVAGTRTTTGAALLGSDPHVGLTLPPLWVAVGWRSPGLAAVGLTLPGLPAMLIGRNLHIAWGATNMYALSSSFYDGTADGLVTGTRVERVRTRWWFDRDVRLRETRVGPLVTDAAMLRDLGLPPIALRWRGHEASDEVSAFLAASRATSWAEFRQAFADYAVSGQNVLYADARGHIGQLLALEYDGAAYRTAAALIGDPTRPDHAWGDPIPSPALPWIADPPSGVLVSANNVPVRTDPPLAVLGNADDRVQRMRDLLATPGAVDLERARAVQCDVYAASAHRLAQALAARLPSSGRVAALRAAVRDWDGHYTTQSVGAVAYQQLLDAVVTRHWGEGEAAAHLRGSPALADLVHGELGGALADETIVAAATAAAGEHDPDRTWGDVHRVALEHPLARLPLLGRLYASDDEPASGSTTTLAKSAHAVTGRVHRATYGANARFLADLSDPDATEMVLLGGQDGWPSSTTFRDQVALWRRGETVRVPLRIESLGAWAVVRQRLEP